MNDEQKQLSEKSTAPRRPRLSLSQIDYPAALLKQGVPEASIMPANNLWLKCGLTNIMLGTRRYVLRKP